MFALQQTEISDEMKPVMYKDKEENTNSKN